MNFAPPPPGMEEVETPADRASVNGHTAEPAQKPSAKPSVNAAPKSEARTSAQWTPAVALLERHFEPLRWVVRNTLPQGYAVLAGAPKLGKSWLAYQLAVAVASGHPLWGNDTDAGDVLNLALEDGERRAQDRLRKVLGDVPCPPRLSLATGWPRIGDGGLEGIEAWARSVKAPRLCILDTFQKLRPPSGGTQNAYERDYELHGQVHALATRLRIAILAITHFRKGGSGDWVEAITGSMGISGAADTLLALKGDRGNPTAALHITGRDVQEAELALQRDGPLWTSLGDASAHRMRETRKAIRDVIASAKEPLRPNEVAELAGIGRDLAKKTLRRMAADGQVIATGGRYALPAL